MPVDVSAISDSDDDACLPAAAWAPLPEGAVSGEGPDVCVKAKAKAKGSGKGKGKGRGNPRLMADGVDIEEKALTADAPVQVTGKGKGKRKKVEPPVPDGGEDGEAKVKGKGKGKRNKVEPPVPDGGEDGLLAAAPGEDKKMAAKASAGEGGKEGDAVMAGKGVKRKIQDVVTPAPGGGSAASEGAQYILQRYISQNAIGIRLKGGSQIFQVMSKKASMDDLAQICGDCVAELGRGASVADVKQLAALRKAALEK